MINCYICKESFTSVLKLMCHIKNHHNMTSKDYYDMYIKSYQDGICCVCGKNTRYINSSKRTKSDVEFFEKIHNES